MTIDINGIRCSQCRVKAYQLLKGYKLVGPEGERTPVVMLGLEDQAWPRLLNKELKEFHLTHGGEMKATPGQGVMLF